MEQTQAQRQIQEANERAGAEDLKILESYKGYEVILDRHSTGRALSGQVANIGNEFIHLILCRGYEFSTNTLTSRDLDKSERLPDTTLARKDISQIVLMNDLYNSISEREGKRQK